MDRAFITLVFSICFVQISLGLPSLTCDDIDPILLSTVKCSCQNVGAPGISWYRDGVFLTSCSLLSGQCFISIGYTFTVDSTTSTYTIEFGSYNYTECTNLTCSDSTTPSDDDFQHISVNVTNYSPTLSVVNEPASSHMDGNIDFTTDCIYKANSSDINVKTPKWTAVVNGTEEDDLDIKGTISKTGSCQFCTDDFASKISVRYIHQEEHSESRIKANIRLKLLIDELPYEGTTKYEYYVKVRSGPTSKSWCCFDEIWCIIVFIVVVLMILSYILALVIRCNEQRFSKVIKGCNLWILIIPFVGLILIIIYCCLLCKGCCRKCKVSGCYRKNTVKPRTPIEFTCDDSSVTINSFKVRWKYVSNGGSGLKFLLVWSTGNENEKNEYIPYQNNNSMEYVIRNLIKDTIYNVKICAEINGVKSEFTENLTVKTLDTPDKPKEFTVDPNSVTINSIRLSWKPGPKRGSGHMFNLIWYTKDGNTGCVDIPHNGRDEMHYKLEGLLGATNYNVKIFAECNTVKLECDTEVRFKTKDTPTKPKEFTYDPNSVTSNSVCLSWKPGPKRGSEHKFNLIWYTDDGNERCVDILHNGKNKMRYKLEGLLEATNYNVKIFAECNTVKLECDTEIRFKTEGTPDKPKEFTFHPLRLTSKSVWLSWKPGPKLGSKHMFKLIWYTKDGNTGCVDIKHNGSDEMHYKLEGLSEETDYNVKIFAEYNTVKLECDKEVCFKTEKDKLRVFRKKHREIADSCEDEICCGNCKKTGASHASSAYGLSHKSYLCLDCLEKEHRDEKSEILLNTDSGEDTICCTKCKKPGAPHASKAYCLSHKLYFCLDCLEKKHKDEECVILLNTGNLFYCNLCQPDELNPVECYDLKSLEFRCWKCYILNIQSSTVLSYPDEVTSKLHENSDMNNPCRVHEHEDDTMSTTPADVYCLVCKSNMCDSCFKKHIIKKQNKLKPMSR